MGLWMLLFQTEMPLSQGLHKNRTPWPEMDEWAIEEAAVEDGT
jgi:hypothetical protein